MYEFQTSGPVTVSARLPSGGITMTAEERDGVVVDVQPADASNASRQRAAETQVELDGDTLIVHAPDRSGWRLRGGGIRVTARVPLDSGFDIHVASADIGLAGRWRTGSARTASGDIRIEHVTGDLSVDTASGDLFADAVGGNVRANSASGDVRVGTVGGDATFHAASGDLRVLDTGGSVVARTASGDIELHRTRRGEARVSSASGDVSVSVLPGTGVYMDVRTVSGSTRSDLDVGDNPPADQTGELLSLRLQTISGDVSVLRAPAGKPVHHT